MHAFRTIQAGRIFLKGFLHGPIPRVQIVQQGERHKDFDRLGYRASGPDGKGVDMSFDINRAREVHFTRMQQALEEGLTNINLARSPEEADAARQRAKAKIEELNRRFEEAFPEEKTTT